MDCSLQAPPSMGFSRHEYWSGLSFPSPKESGKIIVILHINEKVKVKVIQLCPTLCDPIDCSLQAPPSMGFSRQEYRSGLPFPSLGDLPPDPGIELGSPALQADALRG